VIKVLTNVCDDSIEKQESIRPHSQDFFFLWIYICSKFHISQSKKLKISNKSDF